MVLITAKKYDMPPGADKLVENLFTASGFDTTSNIQIHTEKPVHGSASRRAQGISIVGVNREGIAVRARVQPGDNKTSRLILIYPPKGMKATQLDERLRAGIIALAA